MQCAPHPQLAGLIKTVWFSAPAPGLVRMPAREHVLPTGLMHLVFRLDGPAVRVFKDAADEAGRSIGHALVGGARAGFYAKDMSATADAVGVQLLPGAAQALLGLPADELAGRHVSLDDVWGSRAGLMREQLLAAPTPQEKLRTLQALLLQRLAGRPLQNANPAVARALRQLGHGMRVEEAVARSGYSHRQFIRLFSQAVGLPPKLYGRVQRFQKALGLMQAGPGGDAQALALVAMDAGYSDQPHFNREFREFSGVTPEQYRLARPASVNHVPVPVPVPVPPLR
ncbi:MULTISPECIES: AraC family transcriptional regulator [unclassified Polaromonas]|uniref:helix-turn-helix domain-containing protein n=1 Tax=unclassified Polaromonas TaxID=2638319 RepID=UPI0013DE2C2B|nr:MULTISPECIES: AraC family transcriptional regulator [unclassified Polaromonas]